MSQETQEATSSCLKRTHYCGDLRLTDAGTTAQINGWVKRRRDHGGVIFVDLRDRTGITQVVFDPQIDEKAHALADAVRSEYVLNVSGTVRERDPGELLFQAGEIELAVDSLNILNTAKTPPFPVEDDIEVAEDIRMRYRFIDLRRPEMQKTLAMRHKAALAARNYMNEQGFLEIETPILMNSTPEGARDVLVPSRHYPGRFYALPQSPQQFKQILMMSGVDKYFQIARCFRDEDTRSDRQLEFTQLDIEMSFAGVDDVLEVTEGLMKRIFEEAGDIPVQTPFLRLPYHESMARFGNDKPDTRFGMELTDLSDVMADCDFQVCGQVKAIAAPGGANFSRKDIDDLTQFVATYRAKGLAWVKVTTEGFASGIVKFFTTEQLETAQERTGAKPGDIMFFVADKPKVVADALGNLRLHLGKKLNLIDETQYNFLWIVDYPLFEWNEDENRYEPFHHLFTGGTEETLPLLDTDPGKVQSQHYDLVCNGYEICSGSVRIHQWDIQQKVFEVLGITPEEVESRFGYFIDALAYGTPPHAGVAPGLDRIVMLMRNEENIREVIAFPKSQQGLCPLTHAPSVVTDTQLEELSIRVDAEL
ncbi:Aspartate--tRNA(Asp/Asn) ligase [Geodia barretti]|uniref:Aspartate--tRNA(Asp/Asn) ligase n=1 Tax=Geodia barretti TaxID=519541 RepID=A0AA35T7N0_GEOBA|nr:Aspartate--tRNA(Asp/Asn) ligase [Geodia barretti]